VKLCRYLFKRFLAPTGMHFAAGADSKDLVFVQEVSSLHCVVKVADGYPFAGPVPTAQIFYSWLLSEGRVSE